MRIINRDTVCRVFVDGQLMLTQDGVEPNGQYQIGITAATGEGFNFHAVRNIVLLEARASDWIDVDPEIVPADFPDDWTKPITRKEFAAVAVQVYEKLSGTAAIPVIVSPFTDTTDVEVLKAYNVGIVNGYGNGLYGPDDLLSREQCAAMLTRVFKRITIPDWTLDEDASFPLVFEQPEPFADDELISGWARNSVYFMVANGIINGIGNNVFAPRNSTPREEAIGYATASREQALVIATRMVRNLKQPQ